MGEDLDSLSLKDLQNLEQQLDSALKHIRSRKVHTNKIHFKSQCYFYQVLHMADFTLNFTGQNQLMHESISVLQKKVCLLNLLAQY